MTTTTETEVEARARAALSSHNAADPFDPGATLYAYRNSTRELLALVADLRDQLRWTRGTAADFGESLTKMALEVADERAANVATTKRLVDALGEVRDLRAQLADPSLAADIATVRDENFAAVMKKGSEMAGEVFRLRAELRDITAERDALKLSLAAERAEIERLEAARRAEHERAERAEEDGARLQVRVNRLVEANTRLLAAIADTPENAIDLAAAMGAADVGGNVPMAALADAALAHISARAQSPGPGAVRAAATVPRGHCSRCDRCGWEHSASRTLGCVDGDCSMRPLPPYRLSCAGCGALFTATPAPVAGDEGGEGDGRG